MTGLPSALPAPRTPDPMQAPVLRWGVMGTGWIVERFVDTVRRHTRQQFVAIGSRDAGRARAAADRLRIPRAHGSYEDLAADLEVDVVYVATGHAEHLPCARIAIGQGRHTLVEKPIGLTAGQAAEVAALAADRGVFCAEALWSFYLPRYDVVRQVLDDGVLGELHTVLADHGESFAADHRILRPELHGGPMLDLGTYPLSLATWVLGVPGHVVAASRPHPSGVVGQVGAVLTHGGASQSVVHTSVLGETPTTASISGGAAKVFLPGPFYQPGGVVLTSPGGGDAVTFEEPRIGHAGLFFEAAEVARCVAAGLTESPLRPLADSIAMLQSMDAVGRAVGAAAGDVDPGTLV